MAPSTVGPLGEWGKELWGRHNLCQGLGVELGGGAQAGFPPVLTPQLCSEDLQDLQESSRRPSLESQTD